jgi:hypothetical protein
MTYQGERARPMATEVGRYFEVSKVRIGADGHVSDVLWGEVQPGVDRVVGERSVVGVADVVDALHDGAQVAAVFAGHAHLPERPFVITLHADGRECIAFEGPSSAGRDVADLARLQD